jgi:hypothetical protein
VSDRRRWRNRIPVLWIGTGSLVLKFKDVPADETHHRYRMFVGFALYLRRIRRPRRHYEVAVFAIDGVEETWGPE